MTPVKIFTTLRLVAVWALVWVFLLGQLLVAAPKYSLKITFTGPKSDEDYDGSVVFKDYVESHSNGEIGVDIYPNASLCGNARECAEQVASGVTDINIATTAGTASFYPPIQVLDVPYLIPNDRVAQCIFDGPLVADLRSTILKKNPNMRLMMVGNTGGWRNFATTKKQIKRPSDVKGEKFRTINAEIQVELVKTLGGTPTPIAWPEVYSALASGVVAGTKNGITDIVNQKFHEHVKYITLDGHAYMTALWFMNNKKFKAMDKELKRVVVDGFYFMKNTTRVFPMRVQADAYETFKKAGGKIYVLNNSEKKAFQNAVKPVKQWYVKKFGRTLLDKVEKEVASCEKQLARSYQKELG